MTTEELIKKAAKESGLRLIEGEKALYGYANVEWRAEIMAERYGGTHEFNEKSQRYDIVIPKPE